MTNLPVSVYNTYSKLQFDEADHSLQNRKSKLILR